MTRIVIRGINPEPWAIGTVDSYAKGRSKITPNLKLVTYQNAIREELANRMDVGGTPPNPLVGADIHFYYFRSTERGHPADVTNLNKATEDALQGILFDNDRTNRRVTGEIIEQHPHVEHVGIIIDIGEYEIDPDLHQKLCEQIVPPFVRPFQGIDWTPPEEDYV